MAETSVSLLERLRLGPDPAAWRRLVDLYTPLIRNWLARYAVSPTDLDDVLQEVFGTGRRATRSPRTPPRRGGDP